ncbi:MAG: hypothetical protein CL510_03400 [Actinobacteria bacterium]|nr:hypothetical protein [Actinomycetota bacterium]
MIAATQPKPTTLKLSALTLEHGLGDIDAQAGTIRDISIITEGEAKGHGIEITARTIRLAAAKLLNQRLPAYVTHANAHGDRLLEEIGVFSGFYLSENRIRARNFTAFESFREFQPEQYARLFEAAEKMPDNFGVSIVFEGRLLWELPGDETAEFEGMGQRPADALTARPSVEMTAIHSADFVDSPAANPSLFSQADLNDQPIGKMNAETTNPETDHTDEIASRHDALGDGSASAELEKQRAAEEGGDAPAAEPEEKPKKKARKKKLDDTGEEPADAPAIEPGGEPAEDSLDSAELSSRVAERDRVITGLIAELDEAKAEIDRLNGLLEGAEPVVEDCAAVEDTAPDPATLKAEAVEAYLAANPGATRATAVLEVAKANPGFFQNN